MANRKEGKYSLELPKTFTKKKGADSKAFVDLLPYSLNIEGNEGEERKIVNGIYTGISVEVFDKDGIIALYEGGCFGKASQSRSTPAVVYMKGREEPLGELQSSETLVLNLEEACFLAYFCKCLEIKDMKNETMDFKQFISNAVRVQPKFVAFMTAYLHIRSKGWVVKSGIKYGGHYLMYKHGPSFYHASYLVYVAIVGETSYLQPKNVRGLQRVAESSDKLLLTLEVCLPADNFTPQTTEDFNKISLDENIIRRFNLGLLAGRNEQPSTSKRKSNN